MKKALIIVLVVLIAATGLPILMGAPSMAACHDCGPAVLVSTCAFAIVAAGVAFLLLLLARRFRIRPASTRLLLHTHLLERPPRLA